MPDILASTAPASSFTGPAAPVLGLRPKERLFIDAYLGAARLNASEAARMAGYKEPRTRGMRLFRRLRETIEKELLTLRDKLIMSPDEVMTGITEVARDKHSKDRLNALITLAKIHGLLSEKVTLNLDPKQLKSDLLSALQSLADQYRQPILPVPPPAPVILLDSSVATVL